MRPSGIAILVLVGLIATVASTTCAVEDGSIITLPPSYLNDNYCDCVVDGEDESTTSACAHISKKFVCEKNVDKKAISFAFVKDKVCDCCDGTDEEPGTCEDICIKERDEEIAKVQAEVDKHLKGEVVRRTYAKQGSQGVKQLDGIVKQLRQELKVGDEDLQARIHSQTSDQQTLRKLYAELMEKNQHLQTLAKLSASPSSFGPKREYYPLFGKCFAMQSNEKRFKSGSFEAVPKDFLFELCPFERVTQVGMESGAHPTLLGLWQGWDKDTENIYSGGDECWNGPSRSVSVLQVCGEEDKLVDVRENGKCTYEFVFQSPAACSKKHAVKMSKYLKQISPKQEKDITHDEL